MKQSFVTLWWRILVILNQADSEEYSREGLCKNHTFLYCFSINRNSVLMNFYTLQQEDHWTTIKE
jgi:hypothetical protein